MPKRPDFVCCVLTGLYDIPEGAPGGPRREMKTWCGRDEYGFAFTFTGPTHAALNAKDEGRLLTCRACAEAISAVLLRHAWPYKKVAKVAKRRLKSPLAPVPRGHCNRCDHCGALFGRASGCHPQQCWAHERPDQRSTCAGCGAPFEQAAGR